MMIGCLLGYMLKWSLKVYFVIFLWILIPHLAGHRFHVDEVKLGNVHQQNDIWSGSHTQYSQTLRVTSPVLLCTCRYSQTPLELSKVLPDSGKAVIGTPKSTCSDGVAFRMLRDLTDRIVRFWSFWDLCTDLRGTLREAETMAQLCQILQEQLRPLRSFAGDLMPYCHSCGSYITTRHFILSYSSLLQSQDSLHHNMACIMSISLFIYIRSIWPHMVLEHNRRSTRTLPLRERLEMHYLEAIVGKRWS